MTRIDQVRGISDVDAQVAAGEVRRVLGPWNLVAIGIGCIIGGSIFSLTGVVAGENAGPAILLSFVMAASACAMTGLCYSELASMFPLSGSAYSYAVAAMGPIVGWIIGWDLIMEYGVGAAAVASSWSGYVAASLHEFGITAPAALMSGPFAAVTGPTGVRTFGVINLPAVAVVAGLSFLLMRGVKESASVNFSLVVLKIGLILAVVAAGIRFIHLDHFVPFVPQNTGTFGEFGWSGVLRGAGIMFFAFIGFDVVSTAAQEAVNPRRDVAIGVLGSLAIATVLYILFAIVLVGLVPIAQLRGDPAPLASAINRTPYPILAHVLSLGVVVGQTSAILVILFAQSRVMRAMAVDGLLPSVLAKAHPKWGTPVVAHWVLMPIVALMAGFVPLSDLGQLASIGTLLAFAMTCIGVWVLRYTRPELQRPFRAPFVPIIPILGALVCVILMVSLGAAAWLRLLGWLIVGFAILVMRRSAVARLREARRSS